MERESFEQESIGKFLNDHFVSIKVDREERPDVDKIYMTFVQSTTGSGGWPMSVFLTPERKPFFGGTYFPPDARYGRPSFLQLLEQIAGLWRERKMEIVASADELHARLELITAREMKSDFPLTPELLKRAVESFKEAFDPVHGGFGGAPKFPQPGIPSLVLRGAKRFHDDAATQMVLHTCDRMNAGGIHDQLGGGFARYAVDAEWLPPPFEKMLYEKCQLAHVFFVADFGFKSGKRKAESGNFCGHGARHFGLRFARHDASRRRIFFRRRRRQRRSRGKILLLDEGRTFQAAHRRGIQRGREVFRHHRRRKFC